MYLKPWQFYPYWCSNCPTLASRSFFQLTFVVFDSLCFLVGEDASGTSCVFPTPDISLRSLVSFEWETKKIWFQVFWDLTSLTSLARFLLDWCSVCPIGPPQRHLLSIESQVLPAQFWGDWLQPAFGSLLSLGHGKNLWSGNIWNVILGGSWCVFAREAICLAPSNVRAGLEHTVTHGSWYFFSAREFAKCFHRPGI